MDRETLQSPESWVLCLELNLNKLRIFGHMITREQGRRWRLKLTEPYSTPALRKLRVNWETQSLFTNKLKRPLISRVLKFDFEMLDWINSISNFHINVKNFEINISTYLKN